MRPAMLVGDIDRFFDAIILKRLSNTRRKFARLLFGGAIRQVSFDHDRDRVNRHNQENEHDAGANYRQVLKHLGDGKRILLSVSGGRTGGGILPEKKKESKHFRTKNTS